MSIRASHALNFWAADELSAGVELYTRLHDGREAVQLELNIVLRPKIVSFFLLYVLPAFHDHRRTLPPPTPPADLACSMALAASGCGRI